ncbi:XRE family transcriptional regulator [Achromobacter denitrificans]|uniref:S24 family peptidase n=1 Tax=Achromobacter denitrificans TaxID=32002 RepID=UPI00240E1A70|nr:S24 family peptidase [Achromobacter denitrificans]WFC66453.1 XRE family transcriptional regulator [Achromobacter denitrificans]
MSSNTVRKAKIETVHIEEAAALKRLFKERVKVSQAAFGAENEIGTQGMVWQYLNAGSPLNVKVAVKFAKAMGIDVAEFSPRLAKELGEIAAAVPEDDSDGSEFIAIRRLDVRVSAGHGELVTSEDELSRLSFRADFLRSAGATPEQTVSVSVKGDSMEPLIPDGATILVNRGATSIINGKVYAFRRDSELLVKRLYKGNGGFIARSENPGGGYEDLHLDFDDPQIEIIGRAFWMGCKL